MSSPIDPAAGRSPSATREWIEVPGASLEQVHRPADIAALSRLLAEHHAQGEGVLVCGGGTRLGFANPAKRLSAAISLEGLSGIDVFEPDEGVVHARAGTPIRTLQQVVAAEGWELPVDPPGLATTVGGAIASAAMGPRSHAFGRVADAVLGLELVGADGSVSKCGGRVVKNVTGYDMAKLYTGSFGSLAVITGAWLRLRPQPARRETLACRTSSDRETFERMRELARTSSLRACVWNESPGGAEAEIVIELGSSEAGVRHDRDLLGGAFALEPAAPDAVDRLRDTRTRAASPEPIGIRARVLATRLEPMRRSFLDAGFSISIDLGLGVLTARGGAAGERHRDPASVVRLREQAVACGGHASFEWLPAAAGYAALDVFGEAPGTRALAGALKRRFDPRQILNPGRFVAGV